MVSFLLALVISSVSFCPAVQPPVDGPVVAPFAPIGRYAGHWGVDFAAPPGAAVRTPAAGRVTFAGSVAGRLSVSIDLGRGMVTTVSYLSEVVARRGDRVASADLVARSGRAHDLDAVHLSLRIDGTYVDPGLLFSCRAGDISDALWLTTPPD
jgi:murein DD-endopeptidase MepM/ murein hydrolase activator NlpD